MEAASTEQASRQVQRCPEELNFITILTKTDHNGKYRVSLNPNRNYTVEVRARGFCPVHRPTFRPISGQLLTLDFSLAVCTNIDPVNGCVGDREIRKKPWEEMGNRVRHYHRFGRRHVEGGIINYQSLEPPWRPASSYDQFPYDDNNRKFCIARTDH